MKLAYQITPRLCGTQERNALLSCAVTHPGDDDVDFRPLVFNVENILGFR
jgi:hypothetical protein